MEKGVAMLEKEFDICNIINQVRELSGKPKKVVNLKYKNKKITDYFKVVKAKTNSPAQITKQKSPSTEL